MSTIPNEHLVLSSLLKNKNYFNKVIPFLKKEYFLDDTDKNIFKIIVNYSKKYNKIIEFTIIKNIITTSKLNDSDINDAINVIDTLQGINIPKNEEYLLENAEKFCREKAIYNAIATSWEIYEGENKTDKIEAIPEMLKEAICITFNDSIGHDFDDDAELRWEYYNSPETKIPFEFNTLNALTNGGVNLKTFNLIAAGVNVGKTLLLIILAAMYKRLGYDVLYITNEVSEMEVGQRLDGSLLGVDTDKIIELGKKKYLAKLAKMKENASGRIILKEYPTGTCNSLKIESLLQDLKLKKDFVPTVIINDYITINTSNSTNKNNMYMYYNAIAEELRAITVKYNCIMWSAAQLKTEAMEASEVTLSQLSDSQGIARTADLVWAVIRNEELDRLRQINFIQLKTRFHKQRYAKWQMGIDVGKQQLNDLNQDIDGVTDVYKSKETTKKNTHTDKVKVTGKPQKNTINFNTKKQETTNEYEDYVNV